MLIRYVLVAFSRIEAQGHEGEGPSRAITLKSCTRLSREGSGIECSNLLYRHSDLLYLHHVCSRYRITDARPHLNLSSRVGVRAWMGECVGLS